MTNGAYPKQLPSLLGFIKPNLELSSVPPNQIVWYHGSSQKDLSKLEPGRDSTFKIDIPRENAVYLTTDAHYAKQYGDSLYKAIVDESQLMPDEDVVYELLVDGKTKLDNTLRKEWKNFYGDDWTSSSDYLHGSDDFSLLSYEMKSFVDYLVEKQPQLAKQVIRKSGTAAHLGPVDVELAEA